MPPSQTTRAPVFVCDCDWSVRSACNGLPFYKKHEGKRYCVLHYPGKDKSAVFDEALEKKLEAEDFDFKGVWFPDEVGFFERTFAKPVSFDYATFSAKAYFDYATFDAEAGFVSATFGAEVSFNNTAFGARASFASAAFSAGVNFDYAKFHAE